MTESRFADEDTLAHIAQLEAENARQAAVIEQMRGLIKRLVDVTPGHAGQCSGLKCREPYCYSCNDEESANEYLQGVWNLCGEANEVVLALQPNPEGLNKVRADAVHSYLVFAYGEDGIDEEDRNYMWRIEQGEA